jgi:hypothetical protein
MDHAGFTVYRQIVGGRRVATDYVRTMQPRVFKVLCGIIQTNCERAMKYYRVPVCVNQATTFFPKGNKFFQRKSVPVPVYAVFITSRLKPIRPRFFHKTDEMPPIFWGHYVHFKKVSTVF